MLAWGVAGGPLWATVAGGGVIVGLTVSIAWTMVPLLLMFAMLYFTSALVVLIVIAATSWQAAAGAAVAALVMLAIWEFGYTRRIEGRHAAETAAPVRSLNGGSGSAGRALIVHHPGESHRHTTFQEALAEGLIAQGWRVDLAAANSAAPTNLTPYRLLVLGCPSYNFKPAAPLLRYLARVGDLAGKPVLIVVSGGGLTEPAARRLNQMARDAHGEVIRMVEVWVRRDNRERHGLSDPIAVMRRVGETLEVMDR